MTPSVQKIKRIANRSVSILNGIVGDKLNETALGIDMNFYQNDKIVSLDKHDLADRYAADGAKTSPKICLFIHGLVDDEQTWQFKDDNSYGLMMQRDFDYMPFYMRYNSGLHISQNGQKLATLLEQLYENYPVALEDICIIAHSMGGMVTHSACFYAQSEGCEWSKRVTNIILLATPHLGSYLERFANLTTNILEKVPNWHTRLVGKVLNLRSSGIKDMRFGYLRDTDWQDEDPDSLLRNNKSPVPRMPDTVAYYIVSARLTKSEKHLVNRLFGDALVNTKSATARSKNAEEFNFPSENHIIFPETSHFGLTKSLAVYEQIKSWLTE